MKRPGSLFSGGLIGLVVGAGALGLGGCEEPQGNYNDNQQQNRYDDGQAGLDLLQFTLGLYGVAGEGTQQQRNAAGFTSNLIGEEKRNEAIRNSDTTVNVYNDQPQEQQVYRQQDNTPRTELFCYDYAVDRNGNGFIETEEINKKIIFTRQERGILSANFCGLKGSNARVELHNNKGEKIGEKSFHVDLDAQNEGILGIDFSKLDSGSYSASLYVNGKHNRELVFYIID